MFSASSFIDGSAPAPRTANTLPCAFAPIGAGDPTFLTAGTSFAVDAPARAKTDAETVAALTEFLSALVGAETSSASLHEKLSAAVRDFAALNLAAADRNPALAVPLIVANAVAAGVHSNLLDPWNGNRPFSEVGFAAAVFRGCEIGQSRRHTKRVLVAARRWILLHHLGAPTPKNLDVLTGLEDLTIDDEAVAAYTAVANILGRAPISRAELVAKRADLSPAKKGQARPAKNEARAAAAAATPPRLWHAEMLGRLDGERPQFHPEDPPESRLEMQRRAAEIGAAVRAATAKRLAELKSNVPSAAPLDPRFILSVFPGYFEVRATAAATAADLERATVKLRSKGFHPTEDRTWSRQSEGLTLSARNSVSHQSRELVQRLNTQNQLEPNDPALPTAPTLTIQSSSTQPQNLIKKNNIKKNLKDLPEDPNQSHFEGFGSRPADPGKFPANLAKSADEKPRSPADEDVGAMLKALNHLQSAGDGRAAAEACLSALSKWAQEIHGQRRTKLHGAVALAFVLENPATARQVVPEWAPPTEPGPAFAEALAAKLGLGTSPGRLSEFRTVGDFLLHLRRKSSVDLPLTARFGTYRDLLSVCRGQLSVAESIYRAHCGESSVDEVGLEHALALLIDDHDQDRELEKTEVRALRAALAVADQLVTMAAQSKPDETLREWDKLRAALARTDLENPASVNSPKTGLEIRRQDDRLELHFTAALPPQAGEAVTALSLERGWTKPASAGEAALEFNLSASASLARRQVRRGVAWYHSIIVGLGLPSAA